MIGDHVIGYVCHAARTKKKNQFGPQPFNRAVQKQSFGVMFIIEVTLQETVIFQRKLSDFWFLGYACTSKGLNIDDTRTGVH